MTKKLYINDVIFAHYEIGRTAAGNTLWLHVNEKIFKDNKGTDERVIILIIQKVENIQFAAAAYLNINATTEGQQRTTIGQRRDNGQ